MSEIIPLDTLRSTLESELPHPLIGALEDKVAVDITTSADWQEFEQQLKVAFQKYRDGPKDNREWACGALLAAAQFIKRVGDSKYPNQDAARMRFPLEKPFIDLCIAMFNLGKGEVAPILRPNVLKHRHSENLERRQIKENAAITMTILIERKIPRPDAAKAVAGLLRECGVKSGGKNVLDWKTVAAWRDQIKRSHTAKTYAAKLATARREFEENLPKGSVAKVREFALDRLFWSLLVQSEQVQEILRSRKSPAATSRFIKIKKAELRGASSLRREDSQLTKMMVVADAMQRDAASRLQRDDSK